MLRELSDCSVVALEWSDCNVVALGSNARIGVVLELSNDVALGLVGCIPNRLVSNVCSDELEELHDVQLVQPYSGHLVLQLLCIVR